MLQGPLALTNIIIVCIEKNIAELSKTQGGAAEIKKISEALLQEKNLEGPSPGKKIGEAIARKK